MLSNKDDAFVSIDSADLATVNGGYKMSGDGEVTFGAAGAGGVSAALKGKFDYEQSNYESCLNRSAGWTPEQVRDTCGLPPA